MNEVKVGLGRAGPDLKGKRGASEIPSALIHEISLLDTRPSQKILVGEDCAGYKTDQKHR